MLICRLPVLAALHVNPFVRVYPHIPRAYVAIAEIAVLEKVYVDSTCSRYI